MGFLLNKIVHTKNVSNTPISILVVLFIFLNSVIPTVTFAQDDTQPGDSVSKKVTAVLLMDIPNEAVKITSKIQSDLNSELLQPVVYTIRPIIDSIQNKVDVLGLLSDQMLDDQLPFGFYQGLLLRWLRLQGQINKPEKILTDYSTELTNVERVLSDNRKQWSKTHSELLDKDSPEELINRVAEVLNLIDSTAQMMKDSLDLALNLLNRTTEIKMTLVNYQVQIEATQETQFDQILKTRTEPLWSANFAKDSTSFFGANRDLILFGLEDAKDYFNVNKGILSSLGLIFILILSAILWLRRQHKSLSKETKSTNKTGSFIVSRPIVSAFMLTILWSMWALPEMPYLMDKINSFIFLIPFLFIFHGIVDHPLRWSLYFFSILFIYVNFSPFFYVGSGINRFAIIFESIFIAAYLIWFLRHKNKIRPDNRASRIWYQFLVFISPLYLIVILSGIVANIIGYENINRLMVSGILVSLLLALIFGTTYFSIRGLLMLFTVTKIARLSNIIRTKQKDFLKIFDRLAWFVTAFAWFYFSLKSFQLLKPLYEWATDIWNVGYRFGELQVTIGGIISFFIIILLSWLISRLVKLILQEEVLGRFKMPRGVPMAISSITQYALVFTGVIMALAYAGFDLNNLGLIAGALGIGIGFGLQNVVGNFISGLILVFERPVTVGDIVRVEEHDGIVVSIGIRSSIIQQWDGSRIIVPNSDLISKKVLNWTMKKYKRRFIMTINTAPDTDPDLVLKLIHEAISNVEGVLSDPASKTYFKGIVDQSLKFELFYWVSDNILDVESNVNLSVQKELSKAGIKILLPRKVELQKD